MRILTALHRAGVDIRPEEMGVTWDDVGEAVRTLPAYVRDAGVWFTVVDAVPPDDGLVDTAREGIEGLYDREYLGLDPALAWQRTIDVAQRAEEAGFDSLWAYDHFQVDPPPEEAIVFDPLVELSALAMATERSRSARW